MLNRTQIALCLPVIVLSQSAAAQWLPQVSGTTARLRGLSVVSDKTVWASGSGGTCLRTIDGGITWVPRPVADGAALDFRDNHAIDANTAYLLSIGAGEKSRIYKTIDGGTTWTLQHINKDPRGFLDAIAFWNATRGLALGDPVDGRFVILATEDGGKTWKPIAAAGMPIALTGEGAFAASGTCLVVQGNGHAWFGTGGGKIARVLRSTDWGQTWTAHETPIRAGVASAGIFSLAFQDADRGVAVGGDHTKLKEAGDNAAYTSDSGRTWKLADDKPAMSYRSGSVFIPEGPAGVYIAVGPAGTSSSLDGIRWTTMSSSGFDAVSFASYSAGWAVGEGGQIARFDIRPPGKE